MEKVTVRICQRDYSLKTDESPEKIIKLAEQLEHTIHFVARKAKGMSETEITTLAAMLLISDIENILKKSYVPAAEAESKLRHVKDRLDDLKKEMAEQEAASKKKNEKLRAENDGLMGELGQLRNEKDDLSKSLEQYKQSEGNLKIQIEEVNKQLEKQAAIITEDSIKKEQLKTEKENLAKELEQAKQSESGLKTQLEEADKKIEEQAAIIADDSIKKENERLCEEKKAALDELDQSRQTESNLRSDIEELKVKLAEQTAIAEDDSAERENERLKAETEALKSENVKLKQSSESARSQFEELAEVKNEEAERLRLRVAEYEKQINSIEEEYEKELEAVYDEHEKECKSLSEKQAKEISEIKAEYDNKIEEVKTECGKKIAELEDKNKEQEEANAAMQSTLSNYEATFDMYVKNKEKELRQAQEEAEAIRSKNADLEKQLALSGDVQMTIC